MPCHSSFRPESGFIPLQGLFLKQLNQLPCHQAAISVTLLPQQSGQPRRDRIGSKVICQANAELFLIRRRDVDADRRASTGNVLHIDVRQSRKNEPKLRERNRKTHQIISQRERNDGFIHMHDGASFCREVFQQTNEEPRVFLHPRSQIDALQNLQDSCVRPGKLQQHPHRCTRINRVDSVAKMLFQPYGQLLKSSV